MKYRIFVSGVQKELKDERFAVKELVADHVLLKEYYRIFLFEDSPAKGRSARKVYLDEVRKCDIYLGIFGNEYGSVTGDERSATEQEFREACKTDKEILAYIKGRDDKKRDKPLLKLISDIKDGEAG